MKIRKRRRHSGRVAVGYSRCIGDMENGNICGRPADTLDPARGGMVCDLHAPGRPPAAPAAAGGRSRVDAD